VVHNATAQKAQILPTSRRAARAARPEPHHRVGKRIPAKVLHGMQMPPTRPAHLCNLTFRAPRADHWGVLSAGPPTVRSDAIRVVGTGAA
jgi:hypothetical protein